MTHKYWIIPTGLLTPEQMTELLSIDQFNQSYVSVRRSIDKSKAILEGYYELVPSWFIDEFGEGMDEDETYNFVINPENGFTEIG